MCMVLCMALLDMIGVASIMPFMAVLANPQTVETNSFLNAAFLATGFLGVTTTKQFLFFLGVVVFVLLVLSLGFKALTTYVQLRFTLMREYSIGKRFIENYLQQPYSWFLNRHSADLGKSILAEIGAVVGGGMVPMMTLISQGAVAVALLCLLVYVDLKLAIVVGLVLGVAYGLIFKATNGFLLHIGAERVKANQARFTVVTEAFGAAKEVKLASLEKVYVQRFASPAQTYAQHQASAQVISQLPRFALEAIAFGGMLLVVLYLMARSGGFAEALPVVALYALAGYRLMPALQQVYGAITQLRFVGPALEALHRDISDFQPFYEYENGNLQPLTQSIAIKNIFYRYPNAARLALKDVSLNIKARTTVGLVGATGSGKTTTVDLILGLLEPNAGTLEVDGKIIDKSNRRAWQRCLGYVPQQIYLSDDTVAANIAFGVAPEAIDQIAVERAAKIANLHEFVSNEMPDGYKTSVGERGVRLSGGQRQRIGIARALYHNPQVLILDEATSALDNLTEQAVMEAVHNLGHNVTIILIAHRLSTVKECDTIFFLDKGEIHGHGTFKELTLSNERFRAMAAGLK